MLLSYIFFFMVGKKLTLSIYECILENAKKSEINLSAFLETRLVDDITLKTEKETDAFE